MKIAYIAAANDIHTVKWVNEMAARGYEIHLISIHEQSDPLHPDVKYHKLPIGPPIGYFLNVPKLKRLLRQIQPDLIHTFYASGYGTLARLSGFCPNLLSVLGSDVFDFPYESGWKRAIIEKSIKCAFQVASTSWVMKSQTEHLVIPERGITVTPFGVDCVKFSPRERNNKVIRIGTVKKLAPNYGISYLIRSFALAKAKGIEAELVIVGGGPQEEELKRLAADLGVQNLVSFAGAVSHADVPRWLNTFDIYAALSTSESFGVAVVEASACGLPVIVSDVGGLPEVVVNGETGFIVPKEDAAAAADKLVELAANELLRKLMGQKGREFVLQHYEWSENADRMEKLYHEVIEDYKRTKSFHDKNRSVQQKEAGL